MLADFVKAPILIVNLSKNFHDFFPAWFIDSDESGEIIKNNWMKTYYGCLPRKSNCIPCGTQPAPDEITLGSTFLSNNGDLDLGLFFTHDLNIKGRVDNCYYNHNLNFREKFEGIVRGQLHNNINHYRRINLTGMSSNDAIIKTKKPMALYNKDAKDLLFYDRFYACTNSIYGDFFTNISLTINPDEAIKDVFYSVGGYYSINRPKSFQKAINFGGAAFIGHLYSSNGPDMNILYSINHFSNGCFSSNFEVVENYLIDNGSEFHATKNNVYPSLDNEILASSKSNVLHQFWAENKLIVGFSYAVNTEIKNYVVFDDPNDCVLLKTGRLIAKFIQTPQNEIEIIKQVSALYPNDELRVFVKVNFFSGSIYQCKTFTLDNTISIYEVINILPTGAINDYNSNIINYEIEVYKQ